jgi:hypothetical protein
LVLNQYKKEVSALKARDIFYCLSLCPKFNSPI